MFRYLTLSNWLGLSRSEKGRRRQSLRQRPSVRLMLESLEDRVVPSGGNPGQQLPLTPPDASGVNALTRSAATANASATPIGSEEIAANNVSANYCANAQTVTLNARTLASVLILNTTRYDLSTGTVTFSIKDVGSVQATVSGGKASASFTLPAGLAAGNYTISVRYSDSSGQLSEITQATLTITDCSANSAASVNQISQNLASYFANLGSQLTQYAQAVLASFSAVLQGRQPLSTLVQSLMQFYQASSAVQAAEQELSVDPLSFGATGGGESYAASSPAVPQ